MASTPGERLSAMEQRLTDHESRCEERLADIKVDSARTLKAVEGLQARTWALVIAVMAWALAQLWIVQQDRLQRLEHPAKPASAAVAR